MRIKYVGLITSVLALLASSCSIIQDSDIKSAAEVSNLKLTNILIDQATSTGIFSTGMIPLVDKTVAISTPAGTINRYIEMGAPVFPANGKMKYRTSVPTGAKVWVYYFSNGKPSTLGIYKENIVNGKVQDSTFYEVYRFRYDGSGRLSKFTTFLDPAGAPTTNDTLIYTNSQVTTINRKSAGTQTSTTTVQYQGSAVNRISLPTITFNQQGCYTCVSESFSSLGYSQSGTGSGGSNSTPLTITLTGLPGKPQSLSLENMLNMGLAPDTYYFHPLMILNGQLPQGSALLHIYMMDWWKLGAPGGSGGGSSSNPTDKVNFTFNYAKQ